MSVAKILKRYQQRKKIAAYTHHLRSITGAGLGFEFRGGGGREEVRRYTWFNIAYMYATSGDREIRSNSITRYHRTVKASSLREIDVSI